MEVNLTSGPFFGERIIFETLAASIYLDADIFFVELDSNASWYDWIESQMKVVYTNIEDTSKKNFECQPLSKFCIPEVDMKLDIKL